MSALHPSTVAPVAILLALLAAPERARADDGAPLADHSGSTARWSLGFNPVAIAIGRYGGDGEFLAAHHLALVANIHGDYASKALPALHYDRPGPIYGFGGEMGVRMYASNDLSGFFFEFSTIYGFYNVDYYGARLGLNGGGVAIDLGTKIVLGHRFFLALGAGLQALVTTRYPKDIAPGVSFVLGSGIDPRLLVTFGTVIR